MKQKFLIYYLLLLLACSCQNCLEISELEQDLEKTFASRIELPETFIEKNIVINILSNHFGGYHHNSIDTRALSEFSMSPMIIEGDTVMYIVQYDNGWELYSTNPSMEMIPFSSQEGVFNMEDPNMPDALKGMIRETAYDILKSKKEPSDSVDSSWGSLAHLNDVSFSNCIMVLNEDGSYSPLNDNDLPPGHWELIDSEQINNKFEQTPKLTVTNWGQREPWNTYSDIVYDSIYHQYKSAPAGCGPVAMAQYVYFTYKKNGTPAIAKLNPVLNNHRYSFNEDKSGTFPWEKIVLNRTEAAPNTSALLIGYIGHQLEADYKFNSTSTISRSFLNFFEKFYGRSYQMLTYNDKEVITSLKNGYPVFTTALSNLDKYNTPQDIVGHVFLIDYYQKEERTMQYVYGWVRDPLPEGTTDRWMRDLKDINGNILKYAYIRKDFPFLIRTEKISMNWGWNGSFNSTLYSLNANWEAGNDLYNLDKCIYLP